MDDPHTAIMVAWLAAAATITAGIWSANIAKHAARDSANSATKSENMKNASELYIQDRFRRLELYKLVFPFKVTVAADILS